MTAKSKVTKTPTKKAPKSKAQRQAELMTAETVLQADQPAEIVKAKVEAEAVAPKKSKAVKAAPKKAASKANGSDGVIKILTKDGENPYRAGAISRKMFEVMKGYPAMTDYLAQAVEFSKVAEENRRRDVKAWLGNAVRAGYVQIIK